MLLGDEAHLILHWLEILMQEKSFFPSPLFSVVQVGETADGSAAVGSPQFPSWTRQGNTEATILRVRFAAL